MQLLDKLSDGLIYAGMPLVAAYHLVCGNIFINTTAEDAHGLEKLGDIILSPVQYVLSGHKATKDESGYHFVQRFDYTDRFALKTAASYLALPLALPAGSLIKGLAFAGKETRERHSKLFFSKYQAKPVSKIADYAALGIDMKEDDEVFFSQGYTRRPGEEKHLKEEIDLLKEIVHLFKENGIPFWTDCGTCLGAYRYGGIIPWDGDIDIAILQPDFDNALLALNALDKSQYCVQDWSNRCRPKTYIRVYHRKTHNHLDIYHFAIDENKKMVSSILSNEVSPFMVESWKIRERRFTTPTPYEVIFPLKKAIFEGVEVYVPNQTRKYLQERYGENLEPAKVYSPITGNYENDLNHPYWQRPYVH